MTSRERPKEFVRLEEAITPVRSLQLAGLGADVGQEILKAWDLFGSVETRKDLCRNSPYIPPHLRW